MTRVEKFLQANQIDYALYEHQEVNSCKETKEYCKNLLGINCKNLFLRDRKKEKFFLLILPPKKRVNFRKFNRIVKRKVSFANISELREKLGVKPGAVSIFNLLNNKEKDVEVYIDEVIYNAELVNFHPNKNTASIELTKDMFHKLLQIIDNKIYIISL